MAPEPQGEYSPVDSDTEKAESSPFLSFDHRKENDVENTKPRSLRRTALHVLPWLTTILFALTTFLSQRKGIPAFGSYETGFTTDISQFIFS